MTVMEAYEITSAADTGVVKDIFDCLADNEIEWPFLTEDNMLSLDFYYNYSWSGDKTIGPAIEKMHDRFANWRDLIARMFVDAYGLQLLRQWASFSAEYSPEHPYDVHEETDYEHTGSGSTTDSGADSKIRSGSVNTKGGNNIYEYGTTYDNTRDAQLVSKTIFDSEQGDLGTTTQYNNVTDQISYGKQRATEDGAEDSLDTHKYGSLGTMAVSQILRDEIDLWKWNFYTTVFFPLIDRLVALPIY